jgi:hypothetical protein
MKMNLTTPWKQPYKNRFTRTLDRRHDYVEMRDLFERATKYLQVNDEEKFEVACNWANNMICYIGHKNGYHFLGDFPWRHIATIFGSRQYHCNFLDSFNEKVTYLDALMKEREDEFEEKSKRKGKGIGFINRK